MRKIGRLIVSATTVAVVVGLWSPASPAAAAVSERRSMLHATNHTRDTREVRDVHINRSISTLARRHSMAMARRGYLFHTADPSSTYLKGISWHEWGENVGYTSGTVADVQRAFMDSLPHRQNILNSHFRRVAIGAVRVDGLLWVTVFFYG